MLHFEYSQRDIYFDEHSQMHHHYFNNFIQMHHLTSVYVSLAFSYSQRDICSSDDDDDDDDAFV